jgi:hypothetical protein
VIVALAGRRIDAEASSQTRFPEQNVPRVRERLQRLFRDRRVHALVSSAACGADLLGQDVARELGLRRIVVLPFPPSVFRETSVTDRPGNWGALFDQLLAEIGRLPEALVVLDEARDGEGSSAYEKTNHEILARAAALARSEAPPDNVLAVAVWDSRSRGADDLTAAFIQGARAQGLDVEELSTL